MNPMRSTSATLDEEKLVQQMGTHKLSPSLKLILKRSNYPKEILEQISQKKERKMAEKINDREFELNRLEQVIAQEIKDREFEIAKRQLEK